MPFSRLGLCAFCDCSTMINKEAEADTEDSRYKQAAADFVENDDFPIELICPITQTLMHDPVLTVQGNVYERAAITEWLQTHTTGQQVFQ